MLKNKRILEYLQKLLGLNLKNKIETNNSNNNQNRIYLRCSKCKHIITLEKEIEEDIILDCPICGKNGIIRSIKKVGKKTLQSNEFIQYEKLIEIEKRLYKPILQMKLIGIVLIIIGMIFLGITTTFYIKFGFAIILIGIVILGLLTDRKYFFVSINKILEEEYNKNIPNNKNNLSFSEKLRNTLKQFDISENIVFAIIILIVFLYFVTGVNNLEIFLILIYLGLIIIRELTNEFIPYHFKKRMNVFMIGFLIIFIIIITKKVISIVSI